MRRGKYSSMVLPLIQVAPSPGRRITRATEVLRLPVPRYWAGVAMRLHRLLRGQERLRGLRLVRMLRACIDLELRQLGAAEAGAGKHSLHREPQHLRRTAIELLAQRPLAQPAGVARVLVVLLVVEL